MEYEEPAKCRRALSSISGCCIIRGDKVFNTVIHETHVPYYCGFLFISDYSPRVLQRIFNVEAEIFKRGPLPCAWPAKIRAKCESQSPANIVAV